MHGLSNVPSMHAVKRPSPAPRGQAARGQQSGQSACAATCSCCMLAARAHALRMLNSLTRLQPRMDLAKLCRAVMVATDATKKSSTSGGSGGPPSVPHSAAASSCSSAVISCRRPASSRLWMISGTGQRQQRVNGAAMQVGQASCFETDVKPAKSAQHSTFFLVQFFASP